MFLLNRAPPLPLKGGFDTIESYAKRFTQKNTVGRSQSPAISDDDSDFLTQAMALEQVMTNTTGEKSAATGAPGGKQKAAAAAGGPADSMEDQKPDYATDSNPIVKKEPSDSEPIAKKESPRKKVKKVNF